MGSKRGAGTIRFEIRKDKLKKDGSVPIRAIYQLHGQRKYLQTDKTINPEYWDDDSQKAVYRRKGAMPEYEVKDINAALAEVQTKINNIEKRFELDHIQYSPEMVVDEFNKIDKPKTRRDKASKEVYSFIDQYVDDNSTIRSKASLSVYRSLKAHLEGYEKTNGTTVSFDRINHRFFQSFQNYLCTITIKDKSGEIHRRMNNVTVAKQLSTLKTILGYARKDGIEIIDPKFTVNKENDLEIISLTQHEYKTLRDLDLTKRPAWSQVRDVFIFSCATGLRYSDLKQLRREHIKNDELDLRTVKTFQKTSVPLNPDAVTILNKYKDLITPLPVISNQKSNEALGDICKFAGFNTPVEIVRKYGSERVARVYPKYDLIRMHCGRKTFATLMIERGMRAEIVMKIGGWKTWAAFKRYMNISDDTAKAEMRAIFDKSQNLKIV